jgi:hypothetical protein
MRFELPVIWAFHGTTSTGRIELDDDRLTLASRNRTLSFRFASVAMFGIERATGRRLRGLPAMVIRLREGDVVRVASLGGVGSLHQLATVVGTARQPVASGT